MVLTLEFVQEALEPHGYDVFIEPVRGSADRGGIRIEMDGEYHLTIVTFEWNRLEKSLMEYRPLLTAERNQNSTTVCKLLKAAIRKKRIQDI